MRWLLRRVAYLRVWWLAGRYCRKHMLGCDCKVFRRQAMINYLEIRNRKERGRRWL